MHSEAMANWTNHIRMSTLAKGSEILKRKNRALSTVAKQWYGTHVCVCTHSNWVSAKSGLCGSALTALILVPQRRE